MSIAIYDYLLGNKLFGLDNKNTLKLGHWIAVIWSNFSAENLIEPAKVNLTNSFQDPAGRNLMVCLKKSLVEGNNLNPVILVLTSYG